MRIITASRRRLFPIHGSSFKPVQPLCEIGNKSSSVHQLNVCVKMFRTKVKNRISITEKLINRSLTGQRLGLVIHNHLNSRIHLSWSNETGKLNYKDCIERVFLREKEMFVFVKH